MILRSLLALFVVTLVAGPMLVIVRPAYACSCGITSLEDRVASTESIVVGTVREITDRSTRGMVISIAYDLAVEVDEYLKGDGSDTITVRDYSLQGDACSPFDPDAVGKTYLLFLGRDEAGRFITNTCTGSGAISARNRDHMESTIEQIRLLVAGGPAPATEVPPASSADELPQAGAGGDLSEQSNAWLFFGIAGAGLGVAGLGVLLRHGTHRP